MSEDVATKLFARKGMYNLPILSTVHGSSHPDPTDSTTAALYGGRGAPFALTHLGFSTIIVIALSPTVLYLRLAQDDDFENAIIYLKGLSRSALGKVPGSSRLETREPESVAPSSPIITSFFPDPGCSLLFEDASVDTAKHATDAGVD